MNPTFYYEYGKGRRNPLFLGTGLVSYYKLDSNSNDSVGGNNGVDTSITYASGKIGNAAVFNGSISNILIAHNSNLSFSDGTTDFPFSLNLMISFTSDSNVFVIGKSNGVGAQRTWEIIKESGALMFRLSSNNSVLNRVERFISFVPTLNIYYHVTATYDGSKTSTGMKLYINGIEVGATRSIGSAYLGLATTNDNLMIGKFPTRTDYSLNGKIDEVSIFDSVLTQSDIDLLYNNGNGITI